MKYIAHISEDKERQQTVLEHLHGTAHLASQFADKFQFGSWGYCCGLLHDIGKYSSGFQKRILENGKKVDHATAGARVCWEKSGVYGFLSYCIAGHHAGLPDTGGASDSGSQASLMGRMKKSIEDYGAYEKELQIPQISSESIEKLKYSDFTAAFLIRMLFSCLVDADYLDTEAFMSEGRVERDAGDSMQVLSERLQVHIREWLLNEDENTINGRRTEILKACLCEGKEKKGLYRLTVPTGGGKTIASLAFALQHAVTHKMDHIIYVIPYTSIIEQNAKIFSDILGKENVLEHHCNVDYEKNEQLEPMHLAAENWDKPVIVTTNVQFFESLFSNKSSRCRKLHNIANSIVIFDEAQMLPEGYLKPCIAAMEELLSYYQSSLVLCTATQPELHHLFSEDIIGEEICPRVKEQFRFFERTKVKKIGAVSEDELVQCMNQENQALCIVNTKKSAQQIYRKMEGSGVYHLSTSLYPVHRKKVLAEIRKCLAGDKRCLVISTSLVEAGVDLDFQTVFREIAGIDSIVQAAGRCNREGKRSLEQSNVCVFSLDQAGKVPGQAMSIDIAKSIFQNYDDILSLDAIKDYFTALYCHQGEALDKKRILSKFAKRRFLFAEVSKEFRLIEEDTKTIIIAIEEEAQKMLQDLEWKGCSKKRMRDIGQYCVNIYENDFNKFFAAGLLQEMEGGMYYLKQHDKYSSDIGLCLDVEYGEAVIM